LEQPDDGKVDSKNASVYRLAYLYLEQLHASKDLSKMDLRFSNFFRSLGLFLLVGPMLLPGTASSEAAERPTFNKNTADPRPDILPYWLTDGHDEYRKIYNRPRYHGGWVAHLIEPSSQEAMVWCEAYQSGLYDKPHTGKQLKRYYGPKPWEILQTGPRPDYSPAPTTSATEN
jgi:hypothetical protein